jgi:hypothetical protein
MFQIRNPKQANLVIEDSNLFGIWSFELRVFNNADDERFFLRAN